MKIYVLYFVYDKYFNIERNKYLNITIYEHKWIIYQKLTHKTHTKTKTQKDRHTHTQRQRQTQTQTKKHRQRPMYKHIQRNIPKH